MTRLHSTEHFDLHNDDGTHRETCSTADDDADCHPDCGPITIRSPDGTHAHEHPLDGRCWHLDDESDGTLEDSLAEESDT